MPVHRKHLLRRRAPAERPGYGGNDPIDWLAVQSVGTGLGDELGTVAVLIASWRRFLGWLRRRG